MSCPKCGSNNLWDDDMNPIWGCNDCGMMTTAPNNLQPENRFNAGTKSAWKGTKYLHGDGRPKTYPAPVRDDDDDDDY